MALRILFAVEAGADIGLGHLSRSSRLVHALRAGGAEVDVFLRGDDGAVRAARARDIEPAAHVSVTAAANDLRERLEAELGRRSYDWLVVDGYELIAMGIPDGLGLPAGVRTLVMDDDITRPFAATAVLNPNSADGGRYEREGFRLRDRLLGPSFALIDPACRRHRWKGGHGPLARVLVSFGGADRAGWSGRVLAALADYPRLLAVDLVLGPFNRHEFADGAIAGGHRLAVHRAVPSLAPLMAAADAAVVSASVTSWEACAVGVPALALKTADNQAGILATMSARAVAVTAEAAEVLPQGGDGAAFRATLARFDDPAFRSKLSERARTLVDGNGAERVAAYMLGPKHP